MVREGNEIHNIAITDIDPMPDHPFSVRDDEDMAVLKESISEYGVITPLLVRPTENGRYELISGHRRKYACEALGLATVPCEARKCTRDEAIILAVDSNTQREKILPSEKAFAYRMKLDAMNRQGKRTDLTSCPPGTKLNSGSDLATKVGESRRQIYRFIRLTELIPELRDAVDIGEMALTTGTELSLLPEDIQIHIAELHTDGVPYPSYAQANRLKKEIPTGEISKDEIEEFLLTPERKRVIRIDAERIRDWINLCKTPEKLEDTVVKALEYYRHYLKMNSRDNCR